jgi:AcrR family transcriptional regulator
MVEIEQPANARSRRTRSRLLDATKDLLEEGYAGFSVAAVAERAGVSRAAAYLHFESRADLIASLFDHLADRNRLDESLAAVWAAPDAVTALEEWARHLARYHPPMIAIDRAIQHLEASEPDIRAHRKRVNAAQLQSCRRLVEWLAQDGALAPGWTQPRATDALFGLISTDLFERLTQDRRWTTTTLADSLALLLRRTFTTAADLPGRGNRARRSPASKKRSGRSG